MTDGRGGTGPEAQHTTLSRGDYVVPPPRKQAWESGPFSGTGEGLRPKSAPPVREDPAGDQKVINVSREDGEALAQAAAPRRLAWSFRVARGRVSLEVIAAAGEADLLVLGVSGHRLTGGPGETARAAAARAPISVLLLTRGAKVGQPILAAYDGSAAGDRALDLGARLAAAGAGDLEVLVAARDRRGWEALAEQARRRVNRPEAPARWAGGDRLEDVLRSAPPDALLVVGAEGPLLAGGGQERLLDLARCPVLLAR